MIKQKLIENHYIMGAVSSHDTSHLHSLVSSGFSVQERWTAHVKLHFAELVRYQKRKISKCALCLAMIHQVCNANGKPYLEVFSES